jgi:hypothetical protein
MELSRLAADTQQLEVYYCRYMETLLRNHSVSLALLGGYSAIDTSKLWSRPKEAHRLLLHWVSALGTTEDVSAVTKFAEEEILKHNFWAIATLLRRIANRTDLPPPARAELLGMECKALSELMRLVKAKPMIRRESLDAAEISFLEESERDSALQSMLATSAEQAICAFRDAGQLTLRQEKLKREVDAILSRGGR